MKRIFAALVLILVLGACSDPIGDEYGDWEKIGTSLWYGEFTTSDGRTIPCLAWTGGGVSSRGGLSCDWDSR